MKPQIENYNPIWPTLFEAEKVVLENVFSYQFEEIFHFGSTSVPGLAAKPIIDIKARMKAMPPSTGLLDALDTIGYKHRETSDEPEEKYMRFDKGDPIVTHCLHLLLCTESDHTKDMRDYLRVHLEDVLQYSQLKCKILEQEGITMRQYRDEKAPFLAELTKKSAVWALNK